MRLVLLGVLLAFAMVSAACADGRDGAVYEPAREAAALVDGALREARERQVNALLVFGANWCHDSRGLAHTLETHEVLSAYAAEHFAVRFIDIGTRDRNLDQLARFGVSDVFGTPTVLIVGPAGALQNGSSVHHWRTAHDVAAADIGAYLASFSNQQAPISVEASADLASAIADWPSYQTALAAIDADADLSDGEVARLRIYLDGFAMSLARRDLAREARDLDLNAVDLARLDRLGLTAEMDLTEAVAARMAERDMDLLERAGRELNDAGRTR